MTLVAAALVAAGCSSGSSGGGRVDGLSIAKDVATQVRAQLGAADTGSLDVVCPDAPARAGYIVDCTMTGYPNPQFRHVRVTFDDTRGHFHFDVYA